MMKIRIKAAEVEIEYEENTPDNSYFFMTGKGVDYTKAYMECIQNLIDGVETLLLAANK